MHMKRMTRDPTSASDVCLTSICLSRTSDLSREQRGLGRPKLAQRLAHATRDTDITHGQIVKGQLAVARAYCGGLLHTRSFSIAG